MSALVHNLYNDETIGQWQHEKTMMHSSGTMEPAAGSSKPVGYRQMSTIPLSVLELLKCELVPSALRRDFPAESNSHSNPSYIFVRQAANLPTRPAIGLRQAAAMVREGVFGNCAADWGDVVVISDQAHYALLELFTEIHEAWRKYKRRLSDIEKVSAMPSEAAKQSWVNFISR